VIALNMMDIAKGRGYKIDVEKLSEQLGVPVIPTVATVKKGLDELKDAILESARKERPEKPMITYGEAVEGLIEDVVTIIEKDESLYGKYPIRWMAIKLLERDEEVLGKIEGSMVERELMEAIA
jgi:ferrous iron transport protein B